MSVNSLPPERAATAPRSRCFQKEEKGFQIRPEQKRDLDHLAIQRVYEKMQALLKRDLGAARDYYHSLPETLFRATSQLPPQIKIKDQHYRDTYRKAMKEALYLSR